MKYVSKLTGEQIDEIMEIYAPSHTDLEYKLMPNFLDITLRDSEGFYDNYCLFDFSVGIVDWSSKDEHKYLVQYRKKMLSWFGEQYAIDYLLNS